MWPFKATAEYPDLEDRLAKLESALAEDREHHKRALRELDHDMDSLWDKVKHWTGRLAKRADPAQAAPDVPSAPPAAAPNWNEEILRRRSRVPHGNGR